MKRLLLLLLVAAPVQAQSFLAPPHPLFGETGRVTVSENSGDLAIAYPFRLPPARGKYTPPLELSYWSGSGTSSAAGLGWSLSTSFIEANLRAPPLGVDASGATVERAQYWLLLNGDRRLLASTGTPNQYRPAVGHGYLLATSTGNPPTSWTVLDGLGTIYTFAPQGGDASRWYLTTVADTNGNKTVFEYVPDNDSNPSGHYVLSIIRYNNVGSWFGHQVIMGYVNLPAPVPAEGGQGLLGLPNKQLTTVTVKRQSSASAAPSTLYSYLLSYRQSAVTARWLLTGIAQLATDGTPLGQDSALNPLGAQFTYTPFTNAFSLGAYQELAHPAGTTSKALCAAADAGLCTDNTGCQPQDVAAWMDLDGDGLPDMVWGQTSAPNPTGSLSGSGLFWSRNLSRPGKPAFAATQFLSGSDFWRGGGVGGGTVTFKTSGGSRDPSLLRGAQTFAFHSGTGVTMAMMDFDGDGRPDLLSTEAATCTSSTCTPQCTADQLAIRFNRPDPSGAPTFNSVSCLQLPTDLLNDFASMAYVGARMIEWSDGPTGTNTIEQYLGLFDMNGDGILDFVVSAGNSFRVYRGYRNGDGTFGFAPPQTWTPTVPWNSGAAWVATQTYSRGELAQYSGHIYRSLVALNKGNPPTTATDRWMLFNEAWVSTLAYNAGELVQYGGLTYRSLIPSNLGHRPDDPFSSAWTIAILRRPLRQTVNMSDCGPSHPRATTAMLTDLNGDGLIDYVISAINTTDSVCYNNWTYAPWSVSYNTGKAFADRPDGVSWQANWPAVTNPIGTTNPVDPLVSYGRMTDRSDTFQTVALNLDLTKDGRPDRIQNGSGPSCKFQVRTNLGSGFDANVSCIAAPADLISAPQSGYSNQNQPDWQTGDQMNYTCLDNGSYQCTKVDCSVTPCTCAILTCTSTPMACGCMTQTSSWCSPAGKNGQFLDLDGDGVPDYVVADPFTHAIGWYAGQSSSVAWSGVTTYAQGDIVQYGASTYRSLVAANVGHQPDISPAQWASVVRGELISSILQLGGARTDVSYTSSNTFGQTNDGGQVRFVVSKTVVQGPGLQSLVMDYEYATPRIVAALDDPTRREPLGFADSWTRDQITGLVHHSAWGGAPAIGGMPLLVETFAPIAAGQPLSSTKAPNATPFSSTAYVYGSHSATSRDACLTDASGLDGTRLPVVLFDSSTAETRTDGVSLSATKTVACADVDTAGHVLHVAITDDTKDRSWNGAAGVRIENYVYSGAISCPDCLRETWATDPSGQQVFHRWLFYDSFGNVDHVEELANGVHEIAEFRTYNGDGTLASVSKPYAPGAYTVGAFNGVHSYTYDPLGLSVTQDTATDGSTTLVLRTVIDPATGLPSSINDPQLVGSTAPVATKFFAYDKFYRLVAISRAPPGAGGKVVSAIANFEYTSASSSSTGALKSYSFASALAFTPGQVPSTDDVVLSVGYFDALGRMVQMRRRLGSATAGDLSANIERHLSAAGYQVTATVLDGAGREIHGIDSYYSASAAFYDYWLQGSVIEATLDGSPVRAASRGYDKLGRPACTFYGPLAATLPTPPSDATQCVSLFTEGSNYRRATAFRYGADRLTLSRDFLTVDTLADWSNTVDRSTRPGGPPFTRQYLDARGRVMFQQDAYGNFAETRRDILGRTTAAIRWAGKPNSSSVKVSFLTSYDQRGRVVQEDDDSSGTKYYVYLPTGERVLTTHVPYGAAPGSSLATFEKQIMGSLGRIVEHIYSKYSPQMSAGTTACTTVAEQVDDDVLLFYDNPYAGGSYGYTADRLAYQYKRSATAYPIAFGYTADGLSAQRDEWVFGLSGAHTVARSYRNDGLLLATTVASAALGTPVTYSQTYDSYGRPARVIAGTTVFWDTPQTNITTGAYDAVGNLPTELADNGDLKITRSVSVFSDQLLSHSIAPSSGLPFWEWSNATWAGPKLTGNVLKSRYEVAATATYSTATGTSYLFEYDDDGRVSHARATPGSAPGPGTQTFDEQFSFLMDPSGKSLWNLQSVQTGVVDSAGALTGVVTSNYAYQPGAYDRMVEIARSNAPSLPERFGYDERGRGLIVTHTVNGSIVERFAFDAPGRLTGIAVNGLVQENDTFNAEGLLGSRTFGAGSGSNDTARYYVDGDLTLVQRGLATLAYVHVNLGNRRIASMFFSSSTAAAQLVYYHRDRLGSVVGTSTAGGIAGVAYRYDIYGKQTAVVGAETDVTGSELGYSGALKLSDGLLHLVSRTYSPSLRKFLQPDTLDPLRYTYVSGDPANLVDPTGRDAESMEGLVACHPKGCPPPRPPSPPAEPPPPAPPQNPFKSPDWQSFFRFGGSRTLGGNGNGGTSGGTGTTAGGPGAPAGGNQPARSDTGSAGVNAAPLAAAGGKMIGEVGAGDWFKMLGNWAGSAGGRTSFKNFPKWFKEFVKAASGGRCAYCGQRFTPFNPFNLDHVDARANGGNTSLENTGPSCAICNKLKGALRLSGAAIRMVTEYATRSMPSGPLIIDRDLVDYYDRHNPYAPPDPNAVY